MAKAYWISTYRSISKPEALAEYAALAGPAIAAAGGKFLARGGRVEAFESGVKERAVLIEFPSFEAALAAYNSPDYQTAKQKLAGAVDRDIRIVEAAE